MFGNLIHILQSAFICLLFLFQLQTRRLDGDNNTSAAVDHRSKTVEITQQFRTVELPEKAVEREETVQFIKQMCVAI